MVANSFIEIYTLMFAWDVYEGIWDVLTATALAIVPILAVVLNVGIQSLEDDSTSSVAKLEVSIISMLLVLFFCVIPFGGFSSSLSSVEYSLDAPDCQLRAASEEQKKGTGHPQGGLYATTFPEMNSMNVKRPILWIIAQKISSALTHTTIKSMECVNNYALMLSRVAEFKVNDSPLLSEISAFTEHCYLKGMQRFKQNPSALPANIPELDKLDWIGSKTLLKYDNEYYRHPEAYMVPMDKQGFVRDEVNRQGDREQNEGAAPYCYEVWQGAEYGGREGKGLRDKIYENIEADEVGDIVDDWDEWGSQVFSVTEMSSEDKKDMIVKLVLQSQSLDPISTLSVTQEPDKRRNWFESFTDSVSSAVGGVTANVAGIFEAVAIQGEMYKLKILGPIVIAMLQMVVIFCSPIFMVYTGYKLKTFGSLVFTYFALEFIHAIWAVGFWFEQKILKLYLSHAGFMGWVADSQIIENLGTATLFILPAIWLMMASKLGNSAISIVGTTGAPTGVGGGGGGGSTVVRILSKRKGGGGGSK